MKAKLMRNVVLLAAMTIMLSCGGLSPKGKDDNNSSDPGNDPHANVDKDASYNSGSALDAPPECKVDKDDIAFANSVTQNMFGRDLNDEEKAKVNAEGFDRTVFVQDVVSSPEADTGISRFVTNLFNLADITPNMDLEDDALLQDTTLVAQLKQEPIQLVLRNKDKKWDWFFTTKDVYCTKETAKIYEFPVLEESGFVACKLPEDRAGFLGLASVLRAVPSDFVSVNNNYKRVAFALYLAQGFKLLAATNGDSGEGPGAPMPSCMPATDLRKDPDGLAFGSAQVQLQGSTCASCHSPYNGPMSIAFRRFKEDGTTFKFEDIDSIGNGERNGASVELLKKLVNESNSCWSFDKLTPPRKFNGQPGLGRLIAESGTLGKALGVQVPQMLGNVQPDPSMIAYIERTYNAKGETLLAAMEGFFLSESFQCAETK